jgi:hypothetical protein
MHMLVAPVQLTPTKVSELIGLGELLIVHVAPFHSSVSVWSPAML